VPGQSAGLVIFTVKFCDKTKTNNSNGLFQRSHVFNAGDSCRKGTPDGRSQFRSLTFCRFKAPARNGVLADRKFQGLQINFPVATSHTLTSTVNYADFSGIGLAYQDSQGNNYVVSCGP
jgi:hypothetical protein